MRDFEHAFDEYARNASPANLNTCLRTASNYSEGLAGVTCGTAGPLGDLCKQLADWPHPAVRESLKNLYGFCSNYPNLRHGGNPASKLRELDTKDCVAVCLLFLAFSGYLTPHVDSQVVLGSA
jgi:hypothetical protein